MTGRRAVPGASCPLQFAPADVAALARRAGRPAAEAVAAAALGALRERLAGGGGTVLELHDSREAALPVYGSSGRAAGGGRALPLGQVVTVLGCVSDHLAVVAAITVRRAAGVWMGPDELGRSNFRVCVGASRARRQRRGRRRRR